MLVLHINKRTMESIKKKKSSAFLFLQFSFELFFVNFYLFFIFYEEVGFYIKFHCENDCLQP